MKLIRLFFVVTTIISLELLASAFIPQGVHPEAFGASCMAGDYKSNSIDGHSAEGATFVTPPNTDGPTNVRVGLYVNKITEVDESSNSFEDRLGTAMTGLLPAVAYQFIASGNLPKYVFDSYLDSFILLSCLIIILGMGESVYTSWLIKKDKEEHANQLDRISRWFMPLLYIGMIVALYFVYTALILTGQKYTPFQERIFDL